MISNISNGQTDGAEKIDLLRLHHPVAGCWLPVAGPSQTRDLVSGNFVNYQWVIPSWSIIHFSFNNESESIKLHNFIENCTIWATVAGIEHGITKRY